MATACCPTDVKPVSNDYKGVGKYVKIGDVNTYVTGSGTKAIIHIYDIFGQSGHTEQFADRVAAGGNYLVVVPDLIVDAWPTDNVPPRKEGRFPAGVEPADGGEVLMNWIFTHHNTRMDRLDDMKAIKAYLQAEHGVTKLGVVGMCWGGKMAYILANKDATLFDAVAGCHAGGIGTDDVKDLNIPMCFLNSKDEPDTYRTEVQPIVEAKSPNNLVKFFPTMHHGWMGTRGTGALTDFENSEIKEKYLEGIQDLLGFFGKALE